MLLYYTFYYYFIITQKSHFNSVVISVGKLFFLAKHVTN